MSTDDLDYGTDADPKQSAIDAAFAQLDQLAINSERQDAEVARLELSLKSAKAEAKRINEQAIPELMASMRQTKCTTSSGYEISVKQEIRATLPSADEKPEQRAAAMRWLIETGNDGAVKNKIAVTLDKGEDARADELVIRLTRDGFEAQATKEVHAGTLSAIVREMLADGKVVPRDILNVYDQRVAKVKRTK